MPKTKKRKQVTGTPVAEQMFLQLCAAHGLPEPVPEYPFAESIGRDWRFDWLFDGWLALESDGGVHRIKDKWERDMEKLNEAVIMGYVVVRCTPDDIKSGAACALVRRALGSLEEQP